MGDSFYEYMLKVFVMGGRTDAMKTWHDEWEAGPGHSSTSLLNLSPFVTETTQRIPQ